MADTRSRRAKLQAIAAPGSGATDGERANALALLEKLPREELRAPASTARIVDEVHRWDRATADAVDAFLRSYRPGFSNDRRPARRPIVDVPLEEQPRTASGGRVGTLEFGDVLDSKKPPTLKAGG